MFISVSAKLLIKELKELYFIRGIIKAIAIPSDVLLQCRFGRFWK